MKQTQAQQFSFYALLATVGVVGFLFFQVIQPFLLPLLLALILAMLLRPINEQTVRILKRGRYVAAGVITVLALCLVLVPVSAAIFFAGQELLHTGEELLDIDWKEHPIVVQVIDFAERNISEDIVEQTQQLFRNSLEAISKEIYERTRSFISNVLNFIIGIVIVALGLFYLLAENESMGRAIRRLSPLEAEDETALFQEFERVCRGVVVASVLTAFIQAVLAGLIFFILGIDKFWLLASLTMLFSLIPFLGAAGVWGFVAVTLLLDAQYISAMVLIVYGSVLISTADNFIRAYLIHGTARLHPLIALISVLGGLKYVGLWGVFLGPIFAAFFYGVIKILHDRIYKIDNDRNSEAESDQSSGDAET